MNVGVKEIETHKIPALHEIRAEVCRRSFFKFFCEFWSEIISDELYLNWHVKYLCDEIQVIAEGVINGAEFNDDLLCNISPGMTKSTIVSIMLPAWIWTRKPDCITLCNTRKDLNAVEFSTKFRKLILSDKYQKYYPEISIRTDTKALKRIQNTRGGARRQYTTMAIPTGDHGHLRINDDQETRDDAISVNQHERAINSYQAFSTREKKNAYVPEINIMQRVAVGDICEYIQEVKPKIKKIILPAWDNGRVFPPELRDNYIDGLMNPKHVTKEKLETMKKVLGDIRYLAEFGQDCDMTDGYMYQIQKVAKIEDKGIAIGCTDPADDGECFMASVFAKVYGNRVYITNMIYTQDGTEDTPRKKGTISRVAEESKRQKLTSMYIEKDGLGNLYGKLVKRKFPFVTQFNAKGQKDDRIYSKANIISKHFVFLETAPTIEYENAMNSMITYKKIGVNKFKDIQDCMTALADIVIKKNLINIYAN